MDQFEIEYRNGKFYFYIDGTMSNSDDPDTCIGKLKEWLEGNNNG